MVLTGVGRRIGRHGLVLAAVAVSILVATAVLAAVAGLAGAAAATGVRERLAADAGRSVEVDARWTAQGLPAADRAVHTALVRTMGGTPFRTETAFRVTGALALPLPPAGRQEAADTVLPGLPVALPDPGRYATLRSGSWPTAASAPAAPADTPAPSADGTLRVALPEAAADRLGLDSGGSTIVRDPLTGGPLKLTVTGVYRPAPAAAAIWSGLGGGDRAAPVLLLTDSAQLTALPAFGNRTLAVWLALPDTDGLSLARLTALRDRVAAFAAGDTARSVYRGSTPALTDTTVRSDLPAAVDNLALPALTTRAEIAVPLALLAVLAAVVLVLTARRLADAAAAEQALQRSRGAGSLRLLAVAAGEWALAAVPAALAGLLLSEPLLAAVLRSAGVHGLTTAGGRTAWWTAAFALAMHGAALLVPLAVQALDPGAQRALRGRRPLRAGAQRAGADLALLAVAVLGFLQLRHYGGVVARHPGRSLDAGVDPVLVLAPMALAVAGAVLLLRLLPLLGRLLERAASRARGLVLPLGGWQLSRDAGRQSVPVLVTLLAVACGTLAAGVLAALPTGDRDRGVFAVGADLRLSGVSGPSAQRHTALAALPGVTGLTPVAEQSAFVGSTVVRTVAVDTSAAAGSGGLPVLGPDRKLLAPLSAVPAQGIPVPDRPTALEATVQATADQAVAGLQLELWVQDAQGLTDRLTVPSPADGRPHTLTLPLELPGAERRAYPLTISRLGVRFPAELSARTTLDLRLSRIDAVTADRRTGLALPPGQSWFRSGTAFGAPDTLGCPGAGPAPKADSYLNDLAPENDRATACTWQSDGADLLRAVLRSHRPAWLSDLPDLAALDAVFAVLPGTGTSAPALPALPALADRALLAELNARVGDTVHLSWDQRRAGGQPVLITGEIAVLPGYERGQGHLLLDLRALAAARAPGGATPPVDVRWWLSSSDPAATWAAADGRGGFGLAQSARRVATGLADDPFRTGLHCAWLLVLVTAPLFAVTALTLHTVSAVRARRRDFAVLRALGVRRAELTALLRAEQVAVTALPVLLGGLLGLLLADLLLPLLVLDDTSAALFPALDAAPGRPAAALTVLASGLLLALAVLVLTRLLARVDLVRALRAGDTG
ncbi:FtsX-like permease family protein [Kitasatospora sp. NPDC002040]|uniref:FtsX-like permease family protein n=1 Tax=Kitasatospora sp. NPDC002040 TaxID=3154661 RepID=UPI003332AA97